MIYLQTSASIEPRTNISKFWGDFTHSFIGLIGDEPGRPSGPSDASSLTAGDDEAAREATESGAAAEANSESST